jgi:hypothetical protein
MKMPVLHIGQGTMAGPLTVFPVWASAPAETRLVTGLSGQVGVAEREGHPVVGQLVLTNHGPDPVLLLEGELLEGGWQHRVLLHDVVLAPRESLVAAVACVEAGRWGGGGEHRRRARRASTHIRFASSTFNPRTLQSEVWRRVESYETVMGASQTSSFIDHLDRFDSGRMEGNRGGRAAGQLGPAPAEAVVDAWLQAVRGVLPLEGQRGVVVGVAGQPVLLEVFPTHRALAEAMEDLLTGLLLDAVAVGAAVEPTPARRARRIAERLDGQSFHRRPEVDAGLGVPQALDTRSLAARGTSVGDQWAHLSVFNRTHPVLQMD